MSEDQLTESRVFGRVLVVGDANPDLILTGDVVPRFGQVEQLLEQATLTIGGSAAITAHAFARLGRSTSLVAAVGDDPWGERLIDELDVPDLDTGFMVQRLHVPTGLTVVLAQPHDRAILTLPGAVPTLTVDEIKAAVDFWQSRGLAHVHVSSFYLQPNLASAWSELLAEWRASGMTTSLDTNGDPVGTWVGVRELLPHLDVFLPNSVEVQGISGIEDLAQAARTLATAGPLVVVKYGARGAFAATPSGDLFETGSAPFKAVDTTGAGDTFDAAFLDAWLDAASLDTCLRRGARAGALAVTALGGVAGQPTKEELNHWGERDDH